MIFSPIANLALFQGEDKTFELRLNPRQDVSGMTVKWAARSQNVSFLFPPITMAPSDPLSIWVPSVTDPVIPGIQPHLPSQGGTNFLQKNNLPPPGGGLVIQDAATGVFLLSLTSADTIALAPDTFFWTLTRIDSGYNEVLLAGTMNLVSTV